MRNLKLFWFIFFICTLSFVVLLVGISPYLPKQPKFLVTEYNENVQDWQNYLGKNGFFESQIIPQPKFLMASHSATFDILSNGNLLAFWFAGSIEGSPDVKIWQSEFNEDTNNWSYASPIISAKDLAQGSHSFIHKLGNPVVYRALNGDLHLFIVSVGIGGWSVSRLSHLVSYNEGKNWDIARKLMLSPFFNISTLIRTGAVPLEDGSFYLPVYQELLFKYPELVQFDKYGNFIQQIRINTQRSLLQPTIVPLSKDNAVAFFRNADKSDGVVYRQTTNDGGLTWGKLTPTNLNTFDTSLVGLNLGNNKLLMVHNGSVNYRSQLLLSVSYDAGKVWHKVIELENTDGKEFAYPAIKLNKGIVDILYTWNREAIKHVRFNLRWLKEQEMKLNGK